MEQLTTYLVEGRETGVKFLFKYDLNGFIASFQVTGTLMNEQQVNWLFKVPEDDVCPRFPAKEAEFKMRWIESKEMKKKFVITVQPPDLSFDAMWLLYDHKVSKQDALKAYKKLAKNEGDLIKCFTAIPVYNAYIATKSTAKLHLSTYINGRRYEDELPTPVPKYNKPIIGKNFNPVIGDLATKKTDK
ncbi:hypothetical protein GCM10007424_23540 [Flavobacterium suaedae]|uniref:Uncharacterized protein n=1 Tax=Flavobacterium suaedae TaxID=1767027 RepID=A0ABQ1JYY2_9FLAO|nr:hypothetical protein [Flavobacterium suaedae]GGB82798.1 hypothetical protein GCM10007424_23540 [Flavobacterium suaedae]